MKNIFTLKAPTFLQVKKMMALALLIFVQMLFIVPAHSQNPIVTNSATYDVFMNIDPARGLNPTSVATDISTYLNTMGAAANSYRIITSAVTLDPTDVAKWEVYDHYDNQWYANEAAWLASPGGFNNGNIPSNWYYYTVSDPYGDGVKRTIAQLLAAKGTPGSTWGTCSYLQSHIYPFVENGKPAMQFYGYSASGAADFLYYPADVASTKTVKFDVDGQLIDTHTLISAGYLINGGTTGTGSSKTISGYLLLVSAYLNSVNLYRLNGVNVDALHNSGTGATGTLVATYTATIPTKSHMELSITSTSVTATIQALDASGNLTGSKSTMFNSQALINTGYGGFGPFVLYSGHGCPSASAFRFSNIEMALGSVMAGNSALESYQFADYLDNSPNRFFINLTNTSATNYTGTSNDLDNAYLTKMKDDQAIFITDESTGTYLPGTLNQNIKNVATEPTDATVAAALGLADLSSLTAAQKLAAKLAWLIKNTTLGAYGTIANSTSSAIASLYLLEGPGTDANWTGANQINEIMSWLVPGTNINIYLNPDNSVNATGLTATYKLKDPAGTITTITTSTDVNGKKYFAFPKASTPGDYSVTLSYAIGGSITTTVPSTSYFKFAPIPPLDGNPVITGTMQYGQTLTLTPNITTIVGITGTLSYQWKANGVAISGATGTTYTLTANEVGKTISCDITSNAQTGTVNEPATGTVAKITISSASVSAVNSKTFNNTTATTGGTILFSGTINSENPTCSSTIVWTSPNAGTSTVNVSGISLTSMTDRYTLSVTTLSNVTPANNATISKATPTVSVYPTASSITYGQSLQNSTLTTTSAVVNGVSGAIAGSYAWKTSLTKPATAGNFTTATVTFTPTVATNYNSIDFDISVTVLKAILTATADAQSKVYGAVNPTLTFQYSGWVNGENSGVLTTLPSASTTVSNTSAVGVYTGAITISGGVDENYSFSYATSSFTVTKATLTVTADAKSKVYGEANPALTVQYSGWKNGNGIADLTTAPTASTTVTVTSPVAVYTNAITVTGGVDENYSFTFVAANCDVTKAVLTVTADAQTKVFGDANDALTFQYSGWKNGNGIADLTTAPTAVTTVTVTSPVSVYTNAITLSGGADENYSFTYVAADYSVTKAILTVTADSKSKVYGEANPALTFQYSGWINGNSSADLTTLPSASTTVTNTTSVGVHSGAITMAGGADENYSFSYTAADFEVTKATLTVTADAKTKIYGAANPALTFQYSGWLNGDGSTMLTTAPAASTAVTATSPVNIYADAITLSGGADENYNFSYNAASLEVTKATLTVTADAKTKVYGEANPALTFQYSGWMNGDNTENLTALPTASSTLLVTSPVNTYSNDITLTGGVDENYTFSYNAADFTVTKATLSVTADAKTKVYGEANPALTFQYSGWLNGDDSQNLTTVPSASTTVSETTSVGVHTGAIVLAGGADENYSFSYIPANLEITKANLTVTADVKTKVYGEANPELTFQYSGWLNGDGSAVLTTVPNASTTVSLTSPVDVYAGAITLADGADENYSFTYNSANFEVTKATLTVTADAKTKVYGEENPALTFQYSGWKNGDAAEVLTTLPIASSSLTVTSPVAAYTGDITVTGAVDENYNFSYNAADFTVTKATLNVTADAKTKVYGEANPVLTFSYSGFLNSDVVSDIDTDPAILTTADELSDAGSYPIVLAGGIDNNYTLALTDGALTVGKATLTATAENKSKIYSELNPALTIAYSGFKNSDNISAIDLAPAATTSATQTSDAGSYPITLSAGNDNNYDITNTAGNLVIAKADLMVTAENKTRIYSESNPELTYTYSGFVNSENENVLDTKPVAATVALTSDNTGTYPIIASGGSDNNYNFIYTDGILSVTKSMLIITAENKSRKYGEANPALTYAYSGFKNSDDASDIDQLPAITTAAISTTPVGSVPVTLNGGTDNNYDFTLNNGALSVTKTPLAITADNKTKVYGQANPALTISWAGFVNGEDKNALAQVPQIQVATNNASNTGTYPITVAGALSGNYEISYNEGNLTVTKAPLQVNAVDVSKIYLAQIPALTVSYSGFVNNDPVTVLDVKPTATTTANANSDAGTYDITAAGGSDNNYSFIYSKGMITILKADQVISFEDVPEGHRVTQDHPLVATSVSNLPVSFSSSDPFVVNISGTSMVVEKEGSVQITAHQEGNHNWNPATDVTKTVITLPTFDNIRSLFTPNNDGMNDTWYIPDVEQYGKISVQIYNRFGKLLYESADYKNDWNGTYNGSPLPSASYYYLIKSSEKGIIKGVVNLVR
jgi:gliding motility-associated-like protein